MQLTGIVVVGKNEDTGVNCCPHVLKGESQRHQINAMNKIEYISFGDGNAKIQQDMLIVGIPLC